MDDQSFDDDFFDDEDIFELAREKDKEKKKRGEFLKLFAQDFHADATALAKQYMQQFFQDKSLHCGGAIPRTVLFADHRIKMVMNYDIIKGVERAYKHLEGQMSKSESSRIDHYGESTEDVKLVNETLQLLARSGVPQQFAGGMMCLYLEFVEGFNIGTES